MKRFTSIAVLVGIAVLVTMFSLSKQGVAQDGPVAPAPAPAPQPPALNSGTVIVHLRKDVLHPISNVEWFRGVIVQLNNEWVVVRGDYADVGENNGMFAGRSNVWIPRAHILLIAQETR